jgi:hypothetical protein
VSEIKNWDYFKQHHMSPYAGWHSSDMTSYAFIPLSEPCELHATGFDCYAGDCGCAEFKFAKRSEDDIKKIKELQEQVRRESILKQADEIRASESV